MHHRHEGDDRRGADEKDDDPLFQPIEDAIEQRAIRELRL
jgi:hypothetical protein